MQPNAHVDRIRSIAFGSESQRLFVAGDDKQAIVYRRTPNDTFEYERTVRWQIRRGQTGRIFSATTAPGLLAIGGYGAMGTIGEVLLLDSQTGNLLQALVARNDPHRQRLTSLAFSPEKTDPSLASMDLNGRLLLWQEDAQTGTWKAQQVAYNEQQSVRRQLDRTLHPIVALSRSRVVAPVLAEPDARQAKWQLKLYDVSNGQEQLIAQPGEFHLDLITAMAATPLGSILASADSHSQLFLWDLAAQPIRRYRHTLEGAVSSLCFSRDGKTLAIGTGFAGKRSIQLWNVTNPQLSVLINAQDVAHDVLACALSPDGKYLAYSQEGDVVIRNVGPDVTQSITLRAPTPAPTRVAFSKQEPYRIAFSTKPGSNPQLQTVFDPGKGQLDNSQIRQGDWMDPAARGWSLRSNTERTANWVEYNGQRQGGINLPIQTYGVPTAVGWIGDKGPPHSVAVGTTGSNIYVFRIANDGDCRLIRILRGHTGTISSISISHDQRYLASGSSDRTIRIWNLAALDEGAMINRWGASFAVDGDDLVVDSIRQDGPLHFRNLRQGDRIRRLILVDVVNGKERVTSIVDPNDALRMLSERDPMSLVAFEYQRGQAPIAAFQSFPAWQPIASLHVAQNREWAFWTPAGFYDASFEGHKLFGWQVNRGLNTLPDFFLAAQVRQFFERPAIISRLLSVGSLPAAFEAAKAGAPANWSTALAQQQALRPEISILRPTPGQLIEDAAVNVEAQIRVPAGQQLVPPKAFANGVTAPQRQLLRTTPSSAYVDYFYKWHMPIPQDEELLIQVAAATENETVDQESVKVRRDLPTGPRRSRMFVVAAGINDYQDAAVPDLAFARDNAQSVVQTLKRHAEPHYACEAITLLDANVTRATWEITLRHCAAQLRQQVTPDDLLVLFLSGHGVRDERTQEYYYLTANADFNDVKSRQYADCLAFTDLAVFADVPCRKLAILDTCHSGAIQPLTQRELKGALRVLQNDLFLTFTASEGGQQAVEATEKRLGLFTHWLLRGLRGEADRVGGDRDGQVTLAETITFVQQNVLADSARGTHRQYPTAGPSELINLVKIPMSRAGAVRVETSRSDDTLVSSHELDADF